MTGEKDQKKRWNLIWSSPYHSRCPRRCTWLQPKRASYCDALSHSGASKERRWLGRRLPLQCFFLGHLHPWLKQTRQLTLTEEELCYNHNDSGCRSKVDGPESKKKKRWRSFSSLQRQELHLEARDQPLCFPQRSIGVFLWRRSQPKQDSLGFINLFQTRPDQFTTSWLVLRVCQAALGERCLDWLPCQERESGTEGPPIEIQHVD